MSRRRGLGLWLVGILGLALLVAVLPAQGGKRKGTQYAFLVACSGYDKKELKELPFTINDIEGFRQALLATGFEDEHIKVLHDRHTNRRFLSEKAKILKELDLLLDGLQPEDTLVVAVSGHGVHFKGDRTGYFCPVDARLGDRSTLIPMDGEGSLFNLLKGCKARRKLLLVNACRNDPASDLAQAANKVNIDDEDTDQVPEGIVALYSCQQGQKSYFDPERKRGIFFDHVIRAWKGEYHKGDDQLTLDEFMRHVILKTKTDVDRTLEAKQIPERKREYSGEWIIDLTKQELPKRLLVDVAGGVKMEMVLIPKGKFTMGSPEGEEKRQKNEDEHEVEITRDFYLGKYEVTQEEYEALMDSNPSWFSRAKGGKDSVADIADGVLKRFPVENVSWDDAVAFCDKLTAKHRAKSWQFRLPTEAEWEYACRARTKTPFHFGGVLNGKQANCDGNYPYGTETKGPNLARTTKVGSYDANDFGLHDMHGNVWEWCADYYGPYQGLDSKDPVRLKKHDEEHRVLRGGCWSGVPRGCRAAFRGYLAPDSRSRGSDFGFRVALFVSARTP